MTAAKGISTDEVLARLRSGERLAQPVLRDVKKTSAFWSPDLYWYFLDETRVTRSAISYLRKRGIIAIVEEVSFRVIKVID